MKLSYQKQVRIVKRKKKGLSSSFIAKQFKLSTRRIEQIWSYYQKTGTYISLGKPGRKPYRQVSDSVNKKIIGLKQKYGFGATYIAK